MTKTGDIYHGLLVADGNGNLLADEGENKGMPVAYHEGSFIFVKKGEPSHNKRHHKEFAELRATTDEDKEAEPHHVKVQKDDEHIDGITFLPDKVSATASGHTEAYRG